jgi:hypothetical protein
VRFIIVKLLLFFFLKLDAQFGFRFNYSDFSYNQLNSSIPSLKNPLFQSQLEFGIDFWFRLKEKRIEFMPELAVNLSDSKINDITGNHNLYLFYFNVHIYPFDFIGDCDCPTFSKEGNSLKKGFFVHIDPFIGLSQKIYSSTTQKFHALTFGARAGVGIDFGISDLITLSPKISYIYFSEQDWSSFSNFTGEMYNIVESPKGLQAGFRLGFRFDYKGGRKGRKR